MQRFPIFLLSLSLFVSACSGNSATSDSKKDASDKERIQWQSAENLKNSGDLTGAARIYENLVKTSSSPVDAEIELAAIDRKIGKADDAVLIMKDAQKRQPDNRRVPSQLAYALIDAGQSEEAVGIFDSLIRQDSNNALAYSGKGIAFDKAGNHLAAQDLYQQALKIAPGTISIENNLAMSLILNKQLGQAIPMLETLSQQYPDNKTIRHNLALAYGLNGENDKALKLNLKDLTPEQAKENEKFYKYYAHLREKYTASDVSGMQIGFSETPDDKKEMPKPVAKQKPVAKNASPPVDDNDDTDDKPATEAPAEPKPVIVSSEPVAPPANAAPADIPPPAAFGTVVPTSGEAEPNNDFPLQNNRR